MKHDLTLEVDFVMTKNDHLLLNLLAIDFSKSDGSTAPDSIRTIIKSRDDHKDKFKYIDELDEQDIK